jgi:hypothetical protein
MKPVNVEVRGITTTQATGKLWKSLQAAGLLCFVVGATSCAVVMASGEEPGRVSALFLGLALALFAAGRLGAWWHHR